MSSTPGKGGKALPIILAVLLVAALIFGFTANGQKADLEKKIPELTGKVTTLTGEIETAKADAAKAAEETAKAAEETAKAAETAAAKAAEEAAATAAAAEAAAAEAAKAAEEAAAAQAAAVTETAETAVEEVTEAAEGAVETVTETAETAVTEGQEAVEGAVEEVTEAAEGAVETVTETAEAAVAEGQEAVEGAVEAVTETAEAAVAEGQEAVEGAVEAVTETAEAAVAEGQEAVAGVVAEVTETAEAAVAEGKVEVSVFQLKVEIDPMIQAFAKLYNEKHPGVNVTVETLGGGADYGGAIKSKLAAGQMPTLFMIEGIGGYDLWKEYIADMTGADWANDTDLAFFSPEGKVVGFPIAMEGFGLGYNAEILEKAGIDPATLTTFSAVKAAFEKIDGMKAELGLDSVTSVGTSVSGGLWWVTSQHVFNAFYAGYQDYNDSSFYDALRKGEVDQERLTAFANYLKLLYDYADQNVLQNGNYDAQVAAFATGKAAFITQGNWIDPNLAQLGATFKMGYISHNFLEQESTGLYMAAPSWFVVNAQATPEQQQAAVEFLNYMALTEDGANYMVKEAGMVPAFKSVKLLPAGPLSSALVEASARGGNFNWYFGRNPDGFNQGTLGPIFELLATGTSVEDFVKLVTDAFVSIKE